jgi:hypothetical protein
VGAASVGLGVLSGEIGFDDEVFFHMVAAVPDSAEAEGNLEKGEWEVGERRRGRGLVAVGVMLCRGRMRRRVTPQQLFYTDK